MKRELQTVAAALATEKDPIETAAHIVGGYLRK
jgi:hypothetical protein